MGKLVRIITNADEGPKPNSVCFVRPEQENKKPVPENQFFKEQDFNIRINPGRYKLALLSDPRLIMLKARNLPPGDQERIGMSLVERFIYEMETED